jgi:hypothetical protein
MQNEFIRQAIAFDVPAFLGMTMKAVGNKRSEELLIFCQCGKMLN